MNVTVTIPSALRSRTDDQPKVEASGESVREVLADLDRRRPGIARLIVDDSGEIRRSVSIFVNDEDVRWPAKVETRVSQGDRVALVPAIAGG